MKTNQTMMLALFGAAVCSFFFGLGEQGAPAAGGGGGDQIGGTGVQNCVNSCCENIYAWWNGTNNISAQSTTAIPPFKQGDNVTAAILTIYVPAQTPGGCNIVLSGGMYDQWHYTLSSAACQNADKTYPVPQPITPTGDPKLLSRNLNRTQCGS